MTNYEKPDIHKQKCAALTEIYQFKNADYGDSFAEVRAKYPSVILVHLFEKYKRLESLIPRNGENAKVNESIDDTLLDMANYCIMELIERQVDKERMNYHGSHDKMQKDGGIL